MRRLREKLGTAAQHLETVRAWVTLRRRCLKLRMETALILLIATVVALAAAWSRERLLRKSNAGEESARRAEQRSRRDLELKEQSQARAALFDRMWRG